VPILLKGVQTWEDALKAYDEGLAGVVLSNHGGRQLDFAPSGIEVLVDVVAHLKEKRGLSFPNEKFQLFVDGGVRRATDILKAIALGATAGMSILNLQETCVDPAWQWALVDLSSTRSRLMVWKVLITLFKSSTFVVSSLSN